jgi:hypothetical protein
MGMTSAREIETDTDSGSVRQKSFGSYHASAPTRHFMVPQHPPPFPAPAATMTTGRYDAYHFHEFSGLWF